MKHSKLVNRGKDFCPLREDSELRQSGEIRQQAKGNIEEEALTCPSIGKFSVGFKRRPVRLHRSAAQELRTATAAPGRTVVVWNTPRGGRQKLQKLP